MDSDDLIIIGCSLNPEDIELISLIEKFQKEKGERHVRVIHKTDSKDSQIYKNFINVLRGYYDHPHGFDINGPSANPKEGAIEFIFKEFE